MKLLLTAAVAAEMAPFEALTGITPGIWHPLGPHRVWLTLTEVGPVAAGYHIQRLIGELHPDWVIQAGVAGAYAGTGLEVGQTVEVVRERLADLGAMIEGKFTELFQEETLENPHRFPGIDYPPVTGLTVNTGCHPQIDEILTLFAADRPAVETMEGYALFYVCRQMGVPFTQLRTVSNRVSPERSSWNLPLATQNLAAALIKTLGKG